MRPGQTITSERKYVPLTSSGTLTLKTDALFYSATDAGQGNKTLTSVTSTLDGHWPSIQINVSSKVPVDRKLSFKRVGSHVFVAAPPEVRSHLVYLYGVECQDFQGPGSTGSGNYGWESIATNEVNAPGCPGKNVNWRFAFGAPGYAVVYGSYTFP